MQNYTALPETVSGQFYAHARDLKRLIKAGAHDGRPVEAGGMAKLVAAQKSPATRARLNNPGAGKTGLGVLYGYIWEGFFERYPFFG